MSHETNVEIFINKQLDVIQTQASGRSKEHKELRDACQELKGTSLPQFSVDHPPPVQSFLIQLFTSYTPFHTLFFILHNRLTPRWPIWYTR